MSISWPFYKEYMDIDVLGFSIEKVFNFDVVIDLAIIQFYDVRCRLCGEGQPMGRFYTGPQGLFFYWFGKVDIGMCD